MAKSHFDSVYADHKLPLSIQANKFILSWALVLSPMLNEANREKLAADVLAEVGAFDLSRYAFLAAILPEGDTSANAKQVVAQAKSCLALLMLSKAGS